MDQRVYLRLGVWLDFSVIGCNWSILSRQQRLMNPLSLGGWWTSKIASHFGLWLLGFWAHFEPFSWECCNSNIRESAFLSRNFLLLTSGNSRWLALFSSQPRLSIFHISYVGQAAEAELEKLRASSVGAPVEWGENIAFVSSFMGKPMKIPQGPTLWNFIFPYRESGYLVAYPVFRHTWRPVQRWIQGRWFAWCWPQCSRKCIQYVERYHVDILYLHITYWMIILDYDILYYIMTYNIILILYYITLYYITLYYIILYFIILF